MWLDGGRWPSAPALDSGLGWAEAAAAETQADSAEQSTGQGARENVESEDSQAAAAQSNRGKGRWPREHGAGRIKGAGNQKQEQRSKVAREWGVGCPTDR